MRIIMILVLVVRVAAADVASRTSVRLDVVAGEPPNPHALFVQLDRSVVGQWSSGTRALVPVQEPSTFVVLPYLAVKLPVVTIELEVALPMLDGGPSAMVWIKPGVRFLNASARAAVTDAVDR
jgi:hypothetical protein